MVRAIYLRRSSEAEGLFRMHGALTEWQTQKLAQVIASTVPVEKGKSNPLEGLVASISLFGDESKPQLAERTEDANIFEDSPSAPTSTTSSSDQPTTPEVRPTPGGTAVRYNSFESVQRLFRMRNARIERPRPTDLEAQERWAREREEGLT